MCTRINHCLLIFIVVSVGLSVCFRLIPTPPSLAAPLTPRAIAAALSLVHISPQSHRGAFCSFRTGIRRQTWRMRFRCSSAGIIASSSSVVISESSGSPIARTSGRGGCVNIHYLQITPVGMVRFGRQPCFPLRLGHLQQPSTAFTFHKAPRGLFRVFFFGSALAKSSTTDLCTDRSKSSNWAPRGTSFFPSQKGRSTLRTCTTFSSKASSSSNFTSPVAELLDGKVRNYRFATSRPLDGLHSCY